MKSKHTLSRIGIAGLPAMGGAMLAVAMFAGQAQAGQSQATTTAEPAPSAWTWGISADYMFRDVDRTEDYWSGTELWHVSYDDFDGDLWGFTAFVSPPNFLNMTIDFSYRTGDLDGTFTNYSLAPNPLDPGTYTGKASFDRDEYVVGLTYPFPNLEWLYLRAEWFQFDEEGDWNYGGGSKESQDYTLWGISTGLGAKYGIPLGNTGANLDLNAFAGLVYFDFEHEEVAGSLTTDWDDWGFLGRIGARVSYPLHDRISVFLGGGYEYLDTGDGSLDMENQGVFVNLGLMGEF
jgi:hypothetical protein